MSLIEILQEALDRETDKIPQEKLAIARKHLTERYRSGINGQNRFMMNDADRLAYLAARMPATFAANLKALEAIQLVKPFTPYSHLDLGAGPGTALWASCSLFPSLKAFTAFEQDAHLISIGKKLSGSTPLQQIAWHTAELNCRDEFPPHDLVTLSYVIGELKETQIEKLIQAAFKAANEILLVIEPGTPAGFQRIRKVREQLLSLGAYPVAPCPHAQDCPMKDSDWCHFSARLMRSSLHRKIKEGQLNYEDEKYSYIAVGKIKTALPEARILRHPQKRTGHLHLTLCAESGIIDTTISKKDGSLYKEARDALWGDTWH